MTSHRRISALGWALSAFLACLPALPHPLAAEKASAQARPAGGKEPSPAPIGAGEIMAKVNDEPIRRSDFERALANFMASNHISEAVDADRRARIRKAVLDGLIGSALLYQQARTMPIAVPESEILSTIAQARASMGEQAYGADLRARGLTETGMQELVRKNLMIQRLIRDTVMKGVVVTEQDVKRYYDEHTGQLQHPEQAETHHIFIKSGPNDSAEQRARARVLAGQALARLKAGEDFAAVARAYSEDHSASRGGELGFVARGQTVAVVDDAIFSLPIGGISDILESPYGFHIIKVTARREAGSMTLEEAQDQIMEVLRQEKSREALEDLVTSLRARARIEILQ